MARPDCGNSPASDINHNITMIDATYQSGRPTREIKLTPDEITKFWSMVRKDAASGCWEWTGRKLGGKGHPYGMLHTKIGDLLAHRISWFLHHGEITKNLHCLHNCPNGDNPSCVNPNHLFLGTHAENISDMDRKGRRKSRSGDEHHYRKNPETIPRGVDSPNAKLTEDAVRKVRLLYAEGNNYCRIGKMLSIDRSLVRKIILRKLWQHVI